MSITNEEVKKIAKLSRLSFSEEEYKNFQTQLSNIMAMINKISEADTENVEPLTSVNNSNLRMREDECTEIERVEELFSNAPGKESELAKEIKCFIVPKVIE